MSQLPPTDKKDALTAWLREHAPDCGDNSCLFGGRSKGGMRTNGGCRCFKDVRPDMKRIFIERMWAAICAPSATLTITAEDAKLILRRWGSGELHPMTPDDQRAWNKLESIANESS